MRHQKLHLYHTMTNVISPIFTYFHHRNSKQKNFPRRKRATSRKSNQQEQRKKKTGAVYNTHTHIQQY